MDRGLVSCVMVTGKTPDHYPLALKALASFHEQSYPRTELIIVNDGPERLLPQCDKGNVFEIYCPPAASENRLKLGALRNIGLSVARGDWVLQFDDDDLSHPQRIEYMLKYARPDHAVLLLWQIRYSFVTGNAFALRYDRPTEGIPGTALFPAGPWRYPAEGKHEDSHFLNANFGDRRIVLDNHVKQFPGPAQYIRLHHGDAVNTWDEAHIMRRYASQHTQLRNTASQMRPEHHRYLCQVLSTYYHQTRCPQLEGAA